MKWVSFLLCLLITLTAATAALEQYEVNFYDPDGDATLDPVYIYGHKILLKNAEETQASLYINDELTTLTKNQPLTIEGTTFVMGETELENGVEIGDGFFNARRVEIEVEHENYRESGDEHVLYRNGELIIDGVDLELESVREENNKIIANIDYDSHFGSVAAGQKIVFYRAPLHVLDVTLARGTESGQELRAMHFISSMDDVDLEYFPSMFIYSDLPLRIVIPNLATEAQHALADNLVTSFETFNEDLDVQKVADNFLTSHSNVNVIAIGDACTNIVTEYYDAPGHCDLDPSLHLLAKGSHYVVALTAKGDAGYTKIKDELFSTAFDTLSASFTGEVVEQEPEPEPIIQVVEEPVVEVEQPQEPEVEFEPIIEEPVVEEPVIEEEIEEEVEEEPKGESRFKQNWKKVWNLLLWFYR